MFLIDTTQIEINMYNMMQQLSNGIDGENAVEGMVNNNNNAKQPRMYLDSGMIWPGKFKTA